MTANRPPKVDLKVDAKWVLNANWVRPDERLLEWAPVWKLPVMEGLPRPRMPLGQALQRIGKTIGLVLLWTVGSVVMLIVLAFVADGLSGASVGGGGKTKRVKGPGVVLHGDGRASMMGRLVTPALRRKGWWVLSDQRVAFVAVKRCYTKFLSGTGTEKKIDGPVPLETVLEIPRERYAYDEDHRYRKTAILRRTKPAGLYRRISLADGSGVDLRRRHQ
ncbi:hypothetical protein ACFQS3_20055 [Glycomyces mayteni]|uniref:Uncharacterized protein n=1 Tax=Glycomyces mayteni TaxID=543887 RepID=A0ABW2DEC3_9ACTN|nr:hypothetical protein GCM10025732_05230 [Glycomyces mayteni]